MAPICLFQNALPLSAAVFRGPKSILVACPPRLDVQSLSPSSWSRVPHNISYVNSLKLSDIRGWSMLSDKTGILVFRGFKYCENRHFSDSFVAKFL